MEQMIPRIDVSPEWNADTTLKNKMNEEWYLVSLCYDWLSILFSTRMFFSPHDQLKTHMFYFDCRTRKDAIDYFHFYFQT